MSVNTPSINIKATQATRKASRILDTISVSQSIITGGSAVVFIGDAAGTSANIKGFSINKGTKAPTNVKTYSSDFIKSNET